MIRTRTQVGVFPSFYLYSYPSPSSYSHTKEKTHSFSTKISHSLSYQAHIYVCIFFSDHKRTSQNQRHASKPPFITHIR